jgi:hypothetical protein
MFFTFNIHQKIVVALSPATNHQLVLLLEFERFAAL